jgi:hypothetical protein
MTPLSQGQHPLYSMPVASFPLFSRVGEYGEVEVPVVIPLKATTGGGGGYGGLITEGEVAWQFTSAGRRFILRDDDDFVQILIAITKAGILD